MEITKEKLTLEEGINHEWLMTNGLGGYSASTVIGTNTRKYHGLLVAPLTPPGRRHVIFSKIDESIEIQDRKYNLFTNIGKEYISEGFKYQEKFTKNYVPIFEYQVEDIKIIKSICMEYGKNTVGVYYRIENGGNYAKFTIAPIMNFRDFHTMSTNHYFNTKQNINGNKVKVIIDQNSQTPVYMNLSEGKYIEHYNDTFLNMYYIEEEKRGFYPEENHCVPGVYEVEILPGEEKELSFICSLEENIEELNVKDIIYKEVERLNEIFDKSELIEESKKKTKTQRAKDDLIKNYLVAADNFVVYRPNFGLHTVLAGYPWFLDWGRDTLIAFEGLLLIPKRYEIAKEVILTMIRDIKYGLVPNGYSGYDNRPLYNSVDASLLLFEQIQKYVEYTGDEKFVKEVLYEKMENILDSYKIGINVDHNNIYLDTDDLIVSGTPETQNTWMDAKYDGVAITPRNGKAVEINALWYNANKIMEGFSKKFGRILKARKYKEVAENCRISFNNKFYNENTKCLYDVLGDAKIRPNQLFALSLTYPVLDPISVEAENVINTVEKKLLNAYGLKTLAKGEKDYVEVYEGDGFKRDSSYHQGITWPWLLGLYYNSLKNKKIAAKDEEKKQEIQVKIDKFVQKTNKTFKKELLENGCIGSIAELYDSAKPQLPKGTFAQAWSVSEVFRIVLEK